MVNMIFLSTIAVSLVTLAGCCHEESENNGGGGAGGGGSGGGQLASLPNCAPGNAPADEPAPGTGNRMRITLNGDGTISKIEGTNAVGLWESSRKDLVGASPSQGACVQRIEIFALNDDPAILLQGGQETHEHAGGQHTGTSPHCHRVYNYQGGSQLVHC